MSKTIAIVNQKGGVGKTTTCVNLAAALGQQGHKVLVCDFDPQGNATSGFGVDKSHSPSVYDVLLGNAPMSKAIVSTTWADVVPSNKALSGATVELIGMDRREYRLKDALEEVKDNYDYIFIDCPPSLDLLTLNGLCACDSVLIPIQCEYYALEGLSELISTLKTVRRKYNSYLDIEGVVFTMYAGRYNLTLQVVEQVQKYFGDKVYQTTIPRTIRISEAPSYGQPINYYEPKGKGSEAYMDLAIEFVKRNRPRDPQPHRRRSRTAKTEASAKTPQKA